MDVIYQAAEWIQGLPVSEYIMISSWAFPTIEALHVIGIAMVFGTIAFVDMRLLGLGSRSRRFTEVARDTLRWTWIGFAIAVVTGLLMFASNATSYITNSFFLWKMALLGCAGVNMAIFETVTVRTVDQWDGEAAAVPMSAKVAGLLSLAFWFGVIATGRWIGFTAFQLPF